MCHAESLETNDRGRRHARDLFLERLAARFVASASGAEPAASDASSGVGGPEPSEHGSVPAGMDVVFDARRARPSQAPAPPPAMRLAPCSTSAPMPVMPGRSPPREEPLEPRPGPSQQPAPDATPSVRGAAAGGQPLVARGDPVPSQEPAESRRSQEAGASRVERLEPSSSQPPQPRPHEDAIARPSVGWRFCDVFEPLSRHPRAGEGASRGDPLERPASGDAVVAGLTEVRGVLSEVLGVAAPPPPVPARPDSRPSPAGPSSASASSAPAAGPPDPSAAPPGASGARGGALREIVGILSDSGSAGAGRRREALDVRVRDYEACFVCDVCVSLCL